MRSTSLLTRAVIATAISATLACSDTPGNPTTAPTSDLTQFDRAEAEFRDNPHSAFARFVSIGTSVSMGWASDGAVAASQDQAWPAQLARMARTEISLPLIGGSGCRPPLQAPLALGTRISGEAAAANPATMSCAENAAGVTLPAQNVALNAALVYDALFTTPENVTDPSNKSTYPRVLAPGQSQILALEAQQPKFASVELGANEVLSARSGIAIPGVTLFRVEVWAPLYTRLVDRVAAATKHGVLVGLINDVATFPGFRRGSELYADRATFAVAFNVTVAPDCENSENLLFVPVRVPVAVGTGLALRKAGQGPFVLSCAGAPATVQDFVLTPSEAAVVNAQMAEMSTYIRAEAERINFAHFELEALYGLPDLKPPFSVVQLMTSMQPYGPYISLDGMHPNALGQSVIARAAAQAIGKRYKLGLFDETANLIASR